MDKKDLNRIDDTEDIEIKEIANNKFNGQRFILYFMTFLFFLLLGNTILSIYNYNQNKNNYSEVIELKDNYNTVLLNNSEEISQSVTKDTFKDRESLTIERINKIELATRKKDGSVAKINLKYIIDVNDFERNVYASSTSDVLTRISYSYDNENWEYLSNVISNDGETISPLTGNYYDIAGYKGTLNILTNYEIEIVPNQHNVVYWRSETIFQNVSSKDLDNYFKAQFKLVF